MMALSWKVIRIFMACNPEKELKKHYYFMFNGYESC